MGQDAHACCRRAPHGGRDAANSCRSAQGEGAGPTSGTSLPLPRQHQRKKHNLGTAQGGVSEAGLSHLRRGPQRSQRKGGKPGVRGRLTGHAAGLPLQGCWGAAAVFHPRFYRDRHVAARCATNATPQTSCLERKEKKGHISGAPTGGKRDGCGSGERERAPAWRPLS